jgi:hypothetical protein
LPEEWDMYNWIRTSENYERICRTIITEIIFIVKSALNTIALIPYPKLKGIYFLNTSLLEWQVGGFLRVLWFSPPTKLIALI